MVNCKENTLNVSVEGTNDLIGTLCSPGPGGKFAQFLASSATTLLYQRMSAWR